MQHVLLGLEVTLSFEDVYAPCMSCTRPCVGVLNRNTDRELDSRHVPRGFFSCAQPGAQPMFMFISANPGGGRDNFVEEGGLYDVDDVNTLVDVQRKFVGSLFAAPRRAYHANLKAMASAYLGLQWPQFAEHAIFTDLVKCTTPKDKPLPTVTKQTCVKAHLHREIQEWRPVALIALGRQAERFLQSLGPKWRAGRPLLTLPHPSYRWEDSKWFIERAEALRREFDPSPLLQSARQA